MALCGMWNRQLDRFRRSSVTLAWEKMRGCSAARPLTAAAAELNAPKRRVQIHCRVREHLFHCQIFIVSDAPEAQSRCGKVPQSTDDQSRWV